MPDKLISICLVILISFQIAQSQKYPTFEQYVLQFNKTYSSAQEFEARRRIYLDNLQRMQLIEIEMGFETGVNQFADRTQTEINQMKNQKLRPLYRSVTPHYSIKRKVGGPSSLDWRAKGAVTSIKDQGYCGSCWAFSTAAFCESSLIINNGFKNDIDLSEQYLLECTQESDCKGGFPAYALLTVLNHGIPREETFPYKPEFQYPSICDSRKNLKIKGKQVYVYFTLSDFEMIYLLQTSPVIVGVGSQGWEFYKGGILKCRSNVTEDHAVLLVGYTPDYWIIKNQWGLEWGEKGFARISRNREQNCLMGVQVDTLAQKHIKTIIFVLVLIMAIVIG